jgi:hypothetical protein
MPPPTHPTIMHVHTMTSTDLEACMHRSRAHRPPRLPERDGREAKRSPAAAVVESPTASSSTPSCNGTFFRIIMRLDAGGSPVPI